MKWMLVLGFVATIGLGPIISNSAQADELITSIQQRLMELGFDPGSVDGAMGPKTEVAIREYQELVSLPATGVPTQSLLFELKRPCQIRQVNFDSFPEGGCQKPKEVSPGIYIQEIQ